MRPVVTARSTHRGTTHPFGPLTVVVDAAAGAGGVGRRLDHVRRAVAATGLAHEIVVASDGDEVPGIARATFEAGNRFIAVAGDDRSVQDVIDGAFDDGTTIVERPVIAVIPAGGVCDLTRSFGLPDDVDGAVSHLRDEATYALDVMKVSTTVDDGRAVRYGHNMVQVGFRAAVAGATSAIAPGDGRVRRFTAFWRTYARWRSRSVTLHVDARSHRFAAWDVVVANGQFVDGGQRLSPRSYPGDGVIDALAFVGPKADAYRMLPRIFMNGGHLPDPGVKELRAKIRVTVEPERPWPVVVDGRRFGSTPVTVQVVPQQVLLKL